MMNPPVWFRWINPPITEEARADALVKAFESLVDEVKTFPVTVDLQARARKMKAEAKLLHSIVRTLEKTPSTYRGGHFYECRDDLVKRAARLELEAKRIVPASKRGHPTDEPRRQCWIEAYLLLAEHGLEAKTTRAGQVAGLAGALWQAATGETYSPDAWFQLGKRGFPGLQQADTNENSDPNYVPGDADEKA